MCRICKSARAFSPREAFGATVAEELSPVMDRKYSVANGNLIETSYCATTSNSLCVTNQSAATRLARASGLKKRIRIFFGRMPDHRGRDPPRL